MAKRKANSRKTRVFKLPELAANETMDLEKRIEFARKKAHALFRDITDKTALRAIGIFLERSEPGGAFEIYTDEGGSPLYMHIEKILLGPPHLQRELTVLFKSSEVEDNNELLHLLQDITR